MAFPKSPATGKGGAVYVNTSDGQLLNELAMTKQASYTYKGVSYTNRVYLLEIGRASCRERVYGLV